MTQFLEVGKQMEVLIVSILDSEFWLLASLEFI